MSKKSWVNALILLLISLTGISFLFILFTCLAETNQLTFFVVVIYLVMMLGLGFYRIYLEEHENDDKYDDLDEKQ